MKLGLSMRKLRLWLIVLGAPAAIFLGLQRQLVGRRSQEATTPDFGGDREQANQRLVLGADPEGNMTCWVRLKVPATSLGFAAETSARVPLRVTKQAADSGYEWIAITKD